MITSRLKVSPASRQEYEIIIGHGLLSACSQLVDLSEYSKIAVVSDTNVAPLWLAALEKGLNKELACSVVVSAGEQYKNLTSVHEILSKFTDAGLDRKSLVINLGGGVIGDMGGFAACIYMRGIDFIQAPTTLLSQVDASVGGKLGVDFAQRKNLVGSFAQPKAVIIDPFSLSTLPERELYSGFAEIIKHGLIKDANLFQTLENNPLTKDSLATNLATNTVRIADIIECNCRIKAAVVEADEQEQGERKILNFGHTFGHAFEAFLLDTQHMLLHGEAISIGMVAEAKLAHIIGMLDSALLKRIQDCLLAHHLPIKLPLNIPWQQLAQFTLNDKKNQSGNINWSLISAIGTCKYDIRASQEQIEEALKFVQP